MGYKHVGFLVVEKSEVLEDFSNSISANGVMSGRLLMNIINYGQKVLI
jgi:hypothetical protein